MWSIPHCEEASIKHLLEFCATPNIEVTEKIDGMNISFGVHCGKPFVKSKKGPVSYDGNIFRELAVRFPETAEIQQAFIDMLEQLKAQGHKYSNDIQYFGEFVHTPKPNIIEYTIQSPTIVLFDIQGVNVRKDWIYSYWCEQLCVHSAPINIRTPQVLNSSIIMHDFTSTVTNEISKHCSILNTRSKAKQEARDLARESIKELLRYQTQHIIARGNECMSGSSLGGNRIEGFVARNVDTNRYFKFVDLESFRNERADEWSGVDELKQQRQELFRNIHQIVFNGADIFIIKDKQYQKVVDDLISDVSIPHAILNDLNLSPQQLDKVCALAIQVLSKYQQSLDSIKLTTKSGPAITTEKTVISSLISNLETGEVSKLIEFTIGAKRMSELESIRRSR